VRRDVLTGSHSGRGAAFTRWAEYLMQRFGNSPAYSAICLDGLVLPGWKPEFDPRQVLAGPNNVAKMLDALQIAESCQRKWRSFER